MRLSEIFVLDPGSRLWYINNIICRRSILTGAVRFVHLEIEVGGVCSLAYNVGRRGQKMTKARNSRVLWVIPLLVAIFSLSFPAYAQYGGGTGDPNDPYLIYTAEQLYDIGTNPEDWDTHFKLMDDIDLSNFSNFHIIGRDRDNYFSGSFDGNWHIISNFSYTIPVMNNVGLFGYVSDPNTEIKNLRLVNCHITVSKGENIGSLVGHLKAGSIANCSTLNCQISGDLYVGGLVGRNGYMGRRVNPVYTGMIVNCSSTGSVAGASYVGGLLGINSLGKIINCYSTSLSTAKTVVGGLIGCNNDTIINCYAAGRVKAYEISGGLAGYHKYSTKASGIFWDIETSEQSTDKSGIGKNTAQMRTASTFIEAGWDFVQETMNGTEDIWWINEGQDYPRLWWEKGDETSS